ncbi:hypothetical protein L249_1153 [Ophiocordyceps polyrhachis-furcata BCC 54312]|uniref:Uncharacterized protein n=1 Tax=Ophiocordyceps polyrhachis-furcata BCC 54312 TaxID=1330021 RepID=A0A367LFH3_9HYPO|nr:hypothetical protein L249_1153 [Ophiocordyceps polyrhachis-furcata BCC 54312]
MQDTRCPPAQFFILSSPNEKENGQLSCPHQGCDGTLFFSAADRHARASGHQVWSCRRAGCELEGVEFESCAAYQLHSLSGAHLGRCRDGKQEEEEDDDDDDDDDIYGSTKGAKGGAAGKNHGQSLLSPDGNDDSSFLCLEPCCPAYKTKGWGEATLSRHVHSPGHSKAVSAGESLKGMDLSPSELASLQATFRFVPCGERHALI